MTRPRFPRHQSDRANHLRGWSGSSRGNSGFNSDGMARMGDNWDIYFLLSVKPESLSFTSNLRDADPDRQIESGTYRRGAAVPT